MSKWTIYGKDGKAKHESLTKYNSDGKVVYQDTFDYSGKWMGECFLTVSIKSAYPIDFQIGDYIDYRGERFTINYDPTVIKKAERGTYGEGFTYDSIKFNSLGNELTEIQFHDWVLSDNKYHYTSLPNFSFYCKDVDDLADRLQANTNRWCQANGFKPGEYWMFYTLKNNTDGTTDSGQTPTHYHRTVQRAVDVLESCGITDTSSTEYTDYLSAIQTQWESVYGKDEDYKDSRDDESYDRTITASGQTVWDMMSAIKQQFGLNFIIRGRNVYIGTAGVPTDHIFMYGKGRGLYEVDKTADQDQKVVTKLHAYGSDENLPTRYYADLNTLPYATITEIVDNASFNYCRFLTDLTYAPRYFTNPLSQYGDNIYAVTIKIDDITVNARVEHLSSDTYVRIYSEYVTTNPDPDDNTDLDNFKKFQTALAAGKQITFTGGVKKDAFPSSHLTAADQNLPDNMAVNYLMLPGFPTKSLADICRAEYDSTKDVTNYYITNPSVENATEVLFHTESGNHVVKFSSDKYDPYILSPNADTLGVKEGDIFCNEENDDNGLKKVYPTIEEVTDKDAGTGSTGARLDAVVKADTIEDNGVWPQNKTTEISGFHIWIPALGFRLDEAASAAGGDEVKISMKNGYCGGRTFDVTDCSQETDGTWKLTCKRSPDNDLDLYFPYSYAASVSSVKEGMTDAYQILAGDNYVLTGIEISELNYVWAASVKLLRKAIHWLCKNDYTRYVYTPKIDEIYMAKQDREAKAAGTDSLHDTLKEGDILLFKDEDLGLNGAVYIDQLNIKENGNNGIPTYDVTLRNEIQVGTLERIQNTVDSIRTDIANGNVGGGGLSTTDIDVLVKQYGLKYFLSKLNADTASGLITFLQGIALGEDGKYYVNEKGQAALKEVLSDNYSHAGFPFGKGYKLSKDDGDGASVLEIDKLYVRMKMIAAALEIRHLSYVGGNYLFSSAGARIYYVEWLDSEGNILDKTDSNAGSVRTYRCYMYTDDGTTATMNLFKADDQARCQNFDIKGGTQTGNGSVSLTNAGNHYWWRRVNAVGEGKIAAKGDDTVYQYVDFLNAAGDYGADSDVPEEEDSMVQFGNWTDSSRQAAILIVVEGEMAPAIIEYTEVGANENHFTIPDPYTQLCPKPGYGNIIRGQFVNTADGSTTVSGSIEEQINSLIDKLEDIQGQADKKFELWFGSGEPHPSSAADTETGTPASEWTTDAEKALHEQDLYYDTDKDPASDGGRAWRWTAHATTTDSTTTTAYYWDEVTDQDTIAALEKAADLQAQVDDIVSDKVISAGNEKSQLLSEWHEAIGSYKRYWEQAEDYKITSDKDTYAPDLQNSFYLLAKMLNGGTEYTEDDCTNETVPAWINADFGKDTYLSDYTETSKTAGVTKSAYSSDDYRSLWKAFRENLAGLLTDIEKAAKAATEAAQKEATAATDSIKAITSDGVLDASEKQTVKRDFIALFHEMYDDEGMEDKGQGTDNKFYNDDISTAFGSLQLAYCEVGKYLNGGTAWSEPSTADDMTDDDLPEWIKEANMGTANDIDADGFRTAWSNMYSCRTQYLTLLSQYANDNAATAQETANDANTAAVNAQTAANKAQEDANSAKDTITNIIEDGTLDPSEKTNIKRDFLSLWHEIYDSGGLKDKGQNNNEWYNSEVENYFNALVSAYQNVGIYLNGGESWTIPDSDPGSDASLPSWLNSKYWKTSHASQGENLVAVWTALYSARAQYLAVLAKVARDMADTANSTAIKKVQNFVSDTTPTPPYSKGDLWTQTANNGNVMICVTSRAEGESYNGNDWADLSDTYNQNGMLLAELAEKIYVLSGTYIEENGSIKVGIGSNSTKTDGEGNLYWNGGSVQRYVNSGWTEISNESYSDAFMSVYNGIGTQTVTVYSSKPTEGMSKYDLVIRTVDYYDTYQKTNVKGNIEILYYDGSSWVMIKESTTAITRNLGNEILNVVYGSDGEGGEIASGVMSVKGITKSFTQWFNKDGTLRENGLLTTKESATMYSKIVDAEGKLVAEADISTYVTTVTGEDGKTKYISNAKIKADNIELEGLVTANEHFKIDEDGNMEAVNGKFSGEITATSGSIGGWALAEGHLGVAAPVYDDSSSTYTFSKYGLSLYDNQVSFLGSDGRYLMTGLMINLTVRFMQMMSDTVSVTDSSKYGTVYDIQGSAWQNFAISGKGVAALSGFMQGYGFLKLTLTDSTTIFETKNSGGHVIDADKVIVNATESGANLLAPTLDVMRNTLGITETEAFAFQLKVIGDLDTKTFYLYGRNRKKDSNGDYYWDKGNIPFLMNRNGDLYDSTSNSCMMNAGDSMTLLIVYDPNATKTIDWNGETVKLTYTARILDLNT